MVSELYSPPLQGDIKHLTDKISYLEAQICKYKAELLEAKHTIWRLQVALLTYKARNILKKNREQ